MSGGGSKGSYEAGALWGLYFTDVNATSDKYAYDVMTGVSAGALNTGVSKIDFDFFIQTLRIYLISCNNIPRVIIN